jgi:hypothetical protein
MNIGAKVKQAWNWGVKLVEIHRSTRNCAISALFVVNIYHSRPSHFLSLSLTISHFLSPSDFLSHPSFVFLPKLPKTRNGRLFEWVKRSRGGVFAAAPTYFIFLRRFWAEITKIALILLRRTILSSNSTLRLIR